MHHFSTFRLYVSCLIFLDRPMTFGIPKTNISKIPDNSNVVIKGFKKRKLQKKLVLFNFELNFFRNGMDRSCHSVETPRSKI